MFNQNESVPFFLKCIRFKSNAFAIAGIDACTSVICGSTVFSILGYIAHTQGKEVEDVIEAGPGLVFMVIK